MRKTHWIAFVSSLLLAGYGCKKSDDGVEKAQERVDEAAEHVSAQRGEVKEEAEDVAEAQKDLVEESNHVAGESKKLDEAKAELASAHATYIAELRARLARLDVKLTDLEGRNDTTSKEAAATMRNRRDELAGKIDRAEDKVSAGWEEFKMDVNNTFDAIEKDLDSAID